jgi:hypothetical protein
VVLAGRGIDDGNRGDLKAAGTVRFRDDDVDLGAALRRRGWRFRTQRLEQRP